MVRDICFVTIGREVSIYSVKDLNQDWVVCHCLDYGKRFDTRLFDTKSQKIYGDGNKLLVIVHRSYTEIENKNVMNWEVGCHNRRNTQVLSWNTDDPIKDT